VSGLLLCLLLSFTVKFLFWQTVGNLSVDCRWPVGSVSVICRPTVDRQSVNGSCSSQLPITLYTFFSSLVPRAFSLKVGGHIQVKSPGNEVAFFRLKTLLDNYYLKYQLYFLLSSVTHHLRLLSLSI